MTDAQKKISAVNQFHLSKADYKGSKSTLCTGCGHDTITSHLISTLFELDIPPHQLIKVSGIGCSSKTPTYFSDKSHGFNSIHGRMAPVATGAKIANRKLAVLGISGDGDTASIGIGGFVHLIRRDLPMVYIIENNGVYGLTKGQFSATADFESASKWGDLNPYTSLDICSMAIDLGCRFVARSFSGDQKQLLPLLASAFRFDGTVVLDIVSPCITFGNHEKSTKSLKNARSESIQLQNIDFVPAQKELAVDFKEGEQQSLSLPDGSHIVLKKIDSQDFKADSRSKAQDMLRKEREKGKILTGLLYYQEGQSQLFSNLNLSEKPLSFMQEEDLKPTAEDFQNIMNSFT